MGGFWTKLFKRKEEYRILFQGLDAAGKTTILYKLKLGDVVTTIPTIGFNVETIEYKNVQITAWDVGGRDKMRPLMRHYYPNTRALVYVVDSADRERFQQARDELHAALAEDDLRDTVLLVLANKQDLPNACSGVHVSEQLELHTLGARRLWNIVEVSAHSGDNLYNALEWLTSACHKQLNGEADAQSKNTDSLQDKTVSILETNSDWVNKAIHKLKNVFLAQT